MPPLTASALRSGRRIRHAPTRLRARSRPARCGSPTTIAAAPPPRSIFRSAGQKSRDKRKIRMFDSQCDLAALVYERDQDPDQILREFASDLKADGYRAVGLVQLGHHCTDTP